MDTRRSTVWLILLLSVSLIAASSITNARAQETIMVNAGSPNVALSIHVAFQENITALSNANLSLDSTNSSQAQVVNSFQTAIRRFTSGATVDPASFKLTANVRQQGRNSSRWIISENLTLTVTGVASSKPGTSSYDLSFIAMNMSDSLKFGGFEFNNIGPTYLLGPINSQGSGVTFYLDRGLIRGGPYLNPVIPGLTTQRFSLLDFSWVPNISTWKNTYRPLDTSSTWTLNPARDRPGLPYNLTIGVRSPEGTIVAARDAFYNLDFQLTAPARTVANGSRITFNLPTTTDFVMPTIIGATLVIAAGSYAAEKRLVRPTGQFKKRRKK